MANGILAADILEQITPRPFAGDVFRVMVNGYPPEKENTVGARWNPRGVAAIYTSSDADQALAEVRHSFSRQPRPVRPDLLLVVYKIHVEIDEVVDLEAAAKALVKIGLTTDKLLADTWTDSQALGNAVVWLGRGGLLVPSARGANKNLVIYPNTAGAYQFEAIEIRKLRAG
jgi:RES domain-containing protein